MKKFIKKILPKNLKIFLIEHRYMFKIIKIGYKKKLKLLFKNNDNKSLSINDKKIWIKKLVRLSYSNIEFTELGKEFIGSEIEIVKKIEIFDNDVILICVCKDDLMKLKKFINHHRKIGINKFIILDNGSIDGSIDWLLKQEDVFLFQTKKQYSSVRRVAWINRIISYIGYNRWYIVLDSDELLLYDNYENKSINDVIKYCNSNNIIRLRSIMLDMYAKEKYYLNGKIDDYINECIYFDKDTYYSKEREDFVNISGGCRKRVFDMIPCLTKYPLFYFRKKDVHCTSHYLYPYKNNFDSKCNLVIMHYKFLPGEIEKYKKIVKEGNYYKGSLEYKKYLNVMEKKKNLNFMYEGTCTYKDSNSLNNIDIYSKINWNDK